MQPKRIYKCILTVHDELALCVPEDEMSVIAEKLDATMSKKVSWAPGLPIACEVHCGNSYGAAK